MAEFNPFAAQDRFNLRTAQTNKSAADLTNLTAKGQIENLLARLAGKEASERIDLSGANQRANTFAGQGFSVDPTSITSGGPGLDPATLAELSKNRDADRFLKTGQGSHAFRQAGLPVAGPMGKTFNPADIPTTPLEKGTTPGEAQAKEANKAVLENQRTDDRISIGPHGLPQKTQVRNTVRAESKTTDPAIMKIVREKVLSTFPQADPASISIGSDGLVRVKVDGRTFIVKGLDPGSLNASRTNP